MFQLIIGRERRNHRYRLIFFTDPRGRDDKIFADAFPLFVVTQRDGIDDLYLRILTRQHRFNHPRHRISGIAYQQNLRLSLITDVVTTLQPDANMQHEEADLIFTDGVRRIFSPSRDGGQRHVPRHGVVLFNIFQQRIGDHYLVTHPGDHRLNMRQQVSMQLFVIQQVVVVLGVDKTQDVIDQRFIIIRIDSTGRDLLYLAGSNMHL